MILTALDQILERSRTRESRTIVVAAANDKAVLQAVGKAVEMNIVEAILVGNEEEIRQLAGEVQMDLKNTRIFDVAAPEESASVAVRLIRQGKANLLMKGLISTAPLLKAVLDKNEGLRKSETLSHFALYQTSFYPKLLGISDAAMNIYPSSDEKLRIIENAVEVMHALGIERPKVALLAPLEIVNEKIQSTVDAAQIKQMKPVFRSGDYLIDGPLALDNAVSKEAALHKGINSEVAGDADILIAPGLDAGNILYKSIGFLSDGISAAIICGAAVPVVLTSRADSMQSKLYSIALAAAI